jgi:plastocyanin
VPGEEHVQKGFVKPELAMEVLVSLFLAQGAWGGTIMGRVSHRGNSSEDLSYVLVSVEDLEAPFPTLKEPAGTKEMNQLGLRFVPHVLPIVAGTTVEFPNSDPVSHNVFSISEAKRFNLGLYGRGVKRSIRFDQPGVVELLCNVHMEMSGYIVVLKNPFFALAKTDGTFQIANVPAGRHRVRCWHEQLAAQEQEIDVPTEGTVSVNFDLSSRPQQTKNSRHNGEITGR